MQLLDQNQQQAAVSLVLVSCYPEVEEYDAWKQGKSGDWIDRRDQNT